MRNKKTGSKAFKSSALLAVCLALTAIAAPAQAATMTFDWTLAGPTASLGGFAAPGSGTFTVTTGSNGDLITAITGEIGGNAITLLPVGTTGSDNLLFPIGTSFTGGVSVVDLDTSGISVSTSLGNYHIFGAGSPFSIGTVSGNDIFESGPGGFGVGTLAISAVPEPSAWAMMILGFASIGAMAYRRRRAAASFT